MRYLIFCLCSASLLFACHSIKKSSTLESLNAEANQVNIIMKGYQPIDPISVIASDTLIKQDFNRILRQFPNDAARIAIGRINRSGSLVFSPVSVARKGESYMVIVDYVKYVNTTIPAKYALSIKKYTVDEAIEQGLINSSLQGNQLLIEGKTNFISTKACQEENSNYTIVRRQSILSTNFGDIEHNSIERMPNQLSESENNYSHKIRIPVYVGVGLRVHAAITVLKDSINIGSLFGLGIAAAQNEITGTLVTQTLGISGKDISQLMPISEQINESTIQNAIQAIGTMKSKLYDEETDIYPQVIGFSLPYNLDGAKDLIESTIHSEIPELIVNEHGNISFKILTVSEN